jgi:hypothetical protein
MKHLLRGVKFLEFLGLVLVSKWLTLSYLKTMDAFLRETVKFAQKTLMETGHLEMMIVAETAVGEKFTFVGNCEDEEQKIRFFRMCSLSFALSRVVRYLAVSEAWMSTKSQKEFNSKDYGPPSQDKNRKECLVISDISYANGKNGFIFEITRDERKKILALQKIRDMTGIEGRMTELLPPRIIRLPKELEPVVNEFVREHKVKFH